MTNGPIDSVSIWVIITILAVGTFLIRLSFIELFDVFKNMPEWLDNALRLIPVAVLTVIVLPNIVTLEPDLTVSVFEKKLIAGGVAAVTAWKTESMVATITVGMGVLWGATFIF